MEEATAFRMSMISEALAVCQRFLSLGALYIAKYPHAVKFAIDETKVNVEEC